MVKVHDGFISFQMAVCAATACIAHYSNLGLLTSCCIMRSTFSVEVSVHTRDGRHCPILKGLEPSSYEVSFHKDCEGEPFEVCHMYFGIANINYTKQ